MTPPRDAASFKLKRDMAVARKSQKEWHRRLFGPLKVGDIITVNAVYVINPDPNMQCVGDEPV